MAGIEALLTDGTTTNIGLRKAADMYELPLRLIAFKDQLMLYNPVPGAYIINMEDSTTGHGSHWVALYLAVERRNPTAYYFDSFGGAPPMEVRNFASRYGAADLYYQNKQIQKLSANYCGQYVLALINAMANGTGSYQKRYLKFLHTFNFIRTI